MVSIVIPYDTLCALILQCTRDLFTDVIVKVTIFSVCIITTTLCIACSGRISGTGQTDGQTDWQTKYYNPRCACAPRVNDFQMYRIYMNNYSTGAVGAFDMSMQSTINIH